MTLTVLIEHYLNVRTENLSQKTVDRYRDRLIKFVEFCNQENKPYISQMDQALITGFKDTIFNSSMLSNNTKYVYIQELKHFLEHLHKYHFLFRDYSILIALPKWERKKKRVLTVTEKEMILSKLPNKTVMEIRNKLIVSLYLFENLKNTHLSDLDVITIDSINKELWLKETKRSIQLGEASWTLLKSYLNQREFLNPKTSSIFITENGGRKLMAQSIRLVIKEAIKNG
jgi:site-specific recombinase XerD